MKAHRYVAHPWHGVSPGEKAPQVLTCYVEIVPSEAVKYELDKASGLLRVDRPQKFSSVPPTLYGFIPQTYCAEEVAKRAAERTGRNAMLGDGDPLDICILTEKQFTHGNILVPAVPVGGLRMLDGNEADDKIIAVMRGDNVYGGFTEVSQLPKGLIDRLRHYFLTYKQSPDADVPSTEIAEVYDQAEAFEVIRRSFSDYRTHYGEPNSEN